MLMDTFCSVGLPTAPKPDNYTITLNKGSNYHFQVMHFGMNTMHPVGPSFEKISCTIFS